MIKKFRHNFCYTRIWAKHNTWRTSKGMEIALEELRFLSPKLKNDCFPFVTAFNYSKNAATEDKTAFLPLFSMLNDCVNQFVFIYKTYPQTKKLSDKETIYRYIDLPKFL